MSKPVLTYSPGRGRMETIRLMLAANGIEWEDAFLKTAEDLAAVRASGVLMFNQVPYVKWEGKDMTQTMAIVRYIARKYNMLGENDEQILRVDMLTEGVRDWFGTIAMQGFVPGVEEGFVKAGVGRYLPVFEKQLSANGSGYLVGNKLSMADVCLFECLLSLQEVSPETFEKFGKCKEFFSLMNSNAHLKKYLGSAKRFPPNAGEYITMVKKIFNF